jgi:hypothetical protein
VNETDGTAAIITEKQIRRNEHMDLMEAMKQRHSVRAYTSRAIEGEVLKKLEHFIGECNRESGLHMQLVKDEPKAFSGKVAHYGKFSGVKNYIAMVGEKTPDLEEKCGYYGEKVVLYAQTLGLNTCWVAMTYTKVKSAFRVDEGEKLCLVIAIGYGEVQGVSHAIKPREKVMKVQKEAPEWFLRGVDAALLAPTAMNQQKFTFSLEQSRVRAKAGAGFYSKIDLGIAKYHFEVGAGKERIQWV